MKSTARRISPEWKQPKPAKVARGLWLADRRKRARMRYSNAKLGSMLCSIASANAGYCGVQPEPRNLALLTRLLASPRLPGCLDLVIGGSGRLSFCASQA